MEKFLFKGFTASDSLKMRADRALEKIMEIAPSDAVVTATLEQDGELFHCALEIGSSSCPLTIETSHKFPSIALDKAELHAKRKLDKWRGSRFIPEDKTPIRAPLRFASS